MLKKIGLPLLALAAMLIVMPTPQAKAGVRFGIGIGGPVYVAPPTVVPAPAYPPAYVAPAPGYYNAPDYYNPYPVYPYPVAPGYVYPYATWGWGGHAYFGGHGGYGGHGYAGRGFGHGFGRR